MTTAGSPTSSPPSRCLGRIDDKGRSFTPMEPHLTDTERAQAQDPDPAAVLRELDAGT